MRYLNAKEERIIKGNIPWEHIDPNIRDLVSFANTINGLATVQSCAGHIKALKTGGFNISDAHIAFKGTERIIRNALFQAVPKCNIRDVSIRRFDDGSFWICVYVDPAEKSKLYELFRFIKEA